MCVSGLIVIDLSRSGAVALVLLEFWVRNGEEYAELAVLYHAAEVLVFTAQRPIIIWALCGRFCMLMSPHCWSRNGWSSWVCFYMYSTGKSALLCHLSHLHLSCTSAKKAFLGQWVVLCSPVEESSCGPFKTKKQRRCFFGWKFIKDFPSSHIHKWKRFGPGLFWCITHFFLSYSIFACAMYWFFVITFFFSTSVSLF